jgi:hypothetical protein
MVNEKGERVSVKEKFSDELQEPSGLEFFKKNSTIIILILFVLCLVLGLFIFKVFNKTSVCGDGTVYGECSSRKPYFCERGILVERASVCGCSNLTIIQDDLCISKHQTNPKNVSLKYILRGDEKEIEIIVYQGIVDYLSKIPRTIYRSKDEEISRADFKIKNINEGEQRVFLLQLLTEIQNIAKSKEDQMRIAVSLVQNIPFGQSDETVIYLGREINYSRYSYEVLYDNEGVCGEKSELLAFLLREMGYGVVFFYYQLENHEAIGIKCPLKYSLDSTGYCFVETTGPSIITDNEIEYNGVGKLYSKPEVIFISEGNSLKWNLYEYGDARRLINLRDNGASMFSSGKLKKLKEKYGLEEVYRTG